MISFFRKIRKKLLTKNKFSKYLLYAIGEIVLVVIGILIAVQVNAWNESQKNKTIETRALLNLRTEFVENNARLDDLLQRKLLLVTTIRTYLELISNDTISIKNKIKAPIPGNYGRTWSATYDVLNSLLSSGEIEKIKNDSLKSLLTSWNVPVTAYIQTEPRLLSKLEDKSNYLTSKIYFNVAGEGTEDYKNFPEKYYPNNTEAKNEAQMASFINTIEYFNLFSETQNILIIQLMIGKRIQRSNATIIQLIDLELQESEN